MYFIIIIFSISIFLTLYDLPGSGLIKWGCQLVRFGVDLVVNNISWSSIIVLKYIHEPINYLGITFWDGGGIYPFDIFIFRKISFINFFLFSFVKVFLLLLYYDKIKKYTEYMLIEHHILLAMILSNFLFIFRYLTKKDNDSIFLYSRE